MKSLKSTKVPIRMEMLLFVNFLSLLRYTCTCMWISFFFSHGKTNRTDSDEQPIDSTETYRLDSFIGKNGKVENELQLDKFQNNMSNCQSVLYQSSRLSQTQP